MIDFENGLRNLREKVTNQALDRAEWRSFLERERESGKFERREKSN